jgi:hypothetical protein
MATLQLDQIDIEIIQTALDELERIYRTLPDEYFNKARAGLVKELGSRFSSYPLKGCCLYELSPQIIETLKNDRITNCQN